jgi:hypothetical protein
MALAGLAALAGLPFGLTARAGAAPDDAALVRTRAQAIMLDDPFKVAVVDITKRYDGPPAARVARAIFAAAQDKQYFTAKLLDASGSPQNEANVPHDDFDKRAALAMNEGKTYLEEVVGRGDSRRLRVATLVPAVLDKVCEVSRSQDG